MVQIKLSIASILIATAIAPAVSLPVNLPKESVPQVPHVHHNHPHNHNHPQGGNHHHNHHNHPHGHHVEQQVASTVDATQPATDPNASAGGPVAAREYVDWLDARSPVHGSVPQVPHVHHNHPHNHNHPQGGNHHHVHHPHGHHVEQAVSNTADATQPATDPNASAGGPVAAREYVDWLSARSPVHGSVPQVPHVHHNHPHNHNHPQGGNHHHVHHPHGHHVEQAVSNTADATQPATDPNASAGGPVAAREYVDWLDARSPVHGSVPQVPHVHHNHPHNHNHPQGGNHHHVHHPHGHHVEQAVSNTADATQPATDPNASAGGPVTAREYIDELFGRDFDYFSLDARDLDLD